jgi:5-formyltetrahydrofolate cyclo-ligase
MILTASLRYFSGLVGSRSHTVVALARGKQVLDAGAVPVGANDVSVDMIVTPEETIAGTSK